VLAEARTSSFSPDALKPTYRASVVARGTGRHIVCNVRRLRFLSAFSGAGGLDIGLEAAGFHVLGCIEKDELARETLTRNRPNWRLLEPCDVSEFTEGAKPSDLGLRRGELELLAGGPPCQPFSKAAQWHAKARTGLKDPRAACFQGFLRLIDVFLPQVVLIENVRGFTEGKTSAMPLLERSLQLINSRAGTYYRAYSQAVDACEYGVPQHRWRSIIVARRDGGEFTLPKPTHRKTPTRSWDAIGDLHPQSPPEALGKWAGLLPSIPEGSNYLHHTPQGKGQRLFGYRTRYWSFLLKLAKDQPSWTLPAQPPQNTGPFHWENRRLTWKEMMRLQSFPKGWKVAGDYEERVRQIGNATPPLLAEVIGREIGRQVFGKRYRRRPTLAIARRRRVPRATALSAVPVRFLLEHHDLRPHPGPGMGPGRNPAWRSIRDLPFWSASWVGIGGNKTQLGISSTKAAASPGPPLWPAWTRRPS
jgi:DNA (cytosine-5)-methyltransferase 1